MCILLCFPEFMKEIKRWDFWIAYAALPNFSQLTKQFENCDFRSPLAFSEWIVRWRGYFFSTTGTVGEEESIYDLIASFQQKIFNYYNEGNNFVSVFALKMLFSNINWVINWKIFLWLYCLPLYSPTIYI